MGEKKKLAKKLVIKYYLDSYDKNAGEAFEEDVIDLLLSDEFESSQAVDDALYDLWLNENQEFDEAERSEQFEKLISQITATQKTEATDVPLEAEKVTVELGVRRSARFFLKIAAVVIPLLVVVAVGIDRFTTTTTPQPQESFMVEWRVPNGKTENHVLEDQSQVWINSGSSLSVIQNDTIRLAELSGESYFDVTKDTVRTFKVKTPTLSIVVKGTKFNVEAYDDQQFERVTLEQGAISVLTEKGGIWNLLAGEQLLYEKNTESVSVIDLNNNYTKNNWRKGALTFHNLSISEMLSMIERKYDIEIIINDETSLPNLLYTAEFQPSSSLQEVLTVVGELTNTEYNIDSDNKERVEIKTRK